MCTLDIIQFAYVQFFWKNYNMAHLTKVYKMILFRNVMFVIFLFFLFFYLLLKSIDLHIRKLAQLVTGVSHKIYKNNEDEAGNSWP